MRNLTIRRAKRFVASLAKMKVYIEDPDSAELEINGVPCRKLGELKNGGEATFQIGDGAAKVFAIADKMSRNYCYDYYQLEEGGEDVYLTGRNELDLGAGNAFRFDNNPNGPDAEQLKKSKKRGWSVMLLAFALGFAAYFIVGALMRGGSAEKPKTFTAQDMSITLTNRFTEKNSDAYTAVYDSRDAAVFVLNEPISLAEGFEDLTVEEYIDIIIEANGLQNAERKNYDGTPGFEYSFTNPDTNDVIKYFSYVYKTADDFWMIQYAVPEEKAGELAPKIAGWAKTVKFAE